MVHGSGEEREAGASERTKQCVGCDSGVGVPHVHIDDVVESLQEDHEDAPADEDTSEDLRNPGDVRAARPREPEEPDRQQQCAQYHRWETFFRDDFSVLLQLAGEARLGNDGDGKAAAHHTKQDTEERESANALVPAPLFLERDRIRFEEQVQDAVDERHVDGNQQQNRLAEQHGEGTEEVRVDDRLEIELHRIGLRMDRPVLCREPDALRAVLQDLLMARLRHKE